MKRLITLAVIMSALILLFMVCGRSQELHPREIFIYAEQNRFDPDTVDVRKGGMVHWINRDTVDYSVYSGKAKDPSEAFSINPLQPGDTFSVKIDTAGKVHFYSHVKPDTMKGVIHAHSQ